LGVGTIYSSMNFGKLIDARTYGRGSTTKIMAKARIRMQTFQRDTYCDLRRYVSLTKSRYATNAIFLTRQSFFREPH